MCIKEGTRLHCPVAMVARQIKNELDLGDIVLPKDTSISVTMVTGYVKIDLLCVFLIVCFVPITSIKIPAFYLEIQSTLVISKSKGPSETLRDIGTSTYQMCSIEEKTI